MLLKKISAISLLIFYSCFSFADYMKGFVGLGYAAATQFVGAETGLQHNFRLEFARLSKNVALEVRATTYENFQNYGAFLKGYKAWRFSDTTATGVHLGLGLGGLYGTKYLNDGLGNRYSYVAGPVREKAVEICVQAYTRFLWDWGVGAGMFFDIIYENSPFLKFYSEKDLGGEKIQRALFGVGLAVDVD
jgi:hypothetical protein